MLHHCARVILSEVNRYLRSKLNLDLDIKKREEPVSFVILGNTAVESKSSKGIMMRLVDIVGVAWCSTPDEYVPKGDGFLVRKKPGAFSLYFLFSLDYKSADLFKNLELLAYITAFFQLKPHFDQYNTPLLQEVGIENFSAELVKMTLSERSMFWSSLHVPYSPSLLYKIGLIFTGDGTLGGQMVSAVSSFDS